MNVESYMFHCPFAGRYKHDDRLNAHGLTARKTYNGRFPASLSIAQHWGCKDPSLGNYGLWSDSHSELSNVVALPMCQNLNYSVNVN